LFWFEITISRAVNPTELKTNVEFPFDGIEIENFPSASETTPLDDPLMVILAPEIAALVSFESTRPVI
jgi:hypothetical protein